MAGVLEPSGCSSGPSCAFPPSDRRAASFGRPVLGPDDRPVIGGNYMVGDVCDSTGGRQKVLITGPVKAKKKEVSRSP